MTPTNRSQLPKVKPLLPPDDGPGVRTKASAATSSFPVAAIGASAGGLEAYSELFRALAVDTGMAFVLVQHLDPQHHSLLSGILSKVTRMPVEEVKANAQVKPNCVYVIPPNAFMAIAQGRFVLTPRESERGQHLSVDFFMRSLAEDRKSAAIGVILSGTGSDGTAGATAIKAEGGLNFAQEPTSAKYDGMPRSAIASGCIDFVLTPQEIARELDRIKHHPYAKSAADVVIDEEPAATKDAFVRIVERLRRSSGRFQPIQTEHDPSASPTAHGDSEARLLRGIRQVPEGP